MKMNRAQVLDTSNHGYILPFKQAVISVERALRKKWGRKCEVPLLSHALSDNDGMRWIVRDIGARTVSLVDASGRATLIDEVEDEA